MILHHIQRAHNPDVIDRRQPWRFQGVLVGSFHPDLVDLATLHLGEELDASSLDEVLALCESIRARVDLWMDEPFGFYLPGQAQPIGSVPRGSVSHLGIRAYGVHANGYTYRDGQLHMWVAKRALDKPTFPGLWDNMVGGGLTAGHTPEEVLEKETLEEAGLSLDQARNVQYQGTLNYQHAHASGIRNDCLYVYDIELPPDVEPIPNDGEVDCFECWPIEKVLEVVDSTEDFKYNCNLVIAEFLLRHKALEGHPAFSEIQLALSERFQAA